MNMFATYHGGGIGKGSAYNAPSTVIQYAYGSLYGTDINYNSGAATAGTTYSIVSANINAGDLLNVTYVNNKDLQVGIAGVYEINWAMNINCSIPNISVKCGFSVNGGGIHVSGKIGFSEASVNDYETLAGTVIKNLQLNDRIAVCFVVLSSNPTIRVGDINLSLHLVKAV